MTETEDLRVDATEAECAEQVLFKCAMAVSERYETCIVCLLTSFHAGVEEMLHKGMIRHGMNTPELNKFFADKGTLQ
jgi:hypothetical protein